MVHVDMAWYCYKGLYYRICPHHLGASLYMLVHSMRADLCMFCSKYGEHEAAAHSLACCSAFCRSSSLLMLPSASVLTLTIFMPAMTADAGLVPCAEVGMMHTLRCESPRDWWYARMAIRPAYSPLAPELGCSDTLSKPVISVSCPARSCRTAQQQRRQRLTHADSGPACLLHVRVRTTS